MRSLARAMRPNDFEELAVWRVSGTIDPAFSNACHRWRIFRFRIYFAASLRVCSPRFDFLPSLCFLLKLQMYTHVVFVSPNTSVLTMEEYSAEKIDTIG